MKGRILLPVTLLLLSAAISNVHAQTVSVKKGILKVDDVEAGHIQNKRISGDEEHYFFRTMDDAPLFEVHDKTVAGKSQLTLVMKAPDAQTTIPYNPQGFSLNATKQIADQLIRGNHFWKDGSWDTLAMRAFITGNGAGIPDGGSIFNAMRPAISPDGKITGYGMPMGRATFTMAGKSAVIKFYNAANMLKAEGSQPQFASSYQFLMNPGGQALAVDNRELITALDPAKVWVSFANTALAQQVKAGYWTVEDTAHVPAAAREQAAFEASVNVVNVPGKVVLEDGTVKEGIINLSFIKQQEKGITTLDFGEKLSFSYKNEFGKTKNATYKPRELKSFEAGGRKFESGQVQQPLMKENHFLELLYRSGKAGIFKWYADDGTGFLVFKADDIEVAVPVDALVKGKKASKEVFEKCSALETFIAESKPAANEIDGRKLADAYCK